jgi:hypothetical protein
LKGDLIFADEEGVPRGHPQALTLVPLGYLFGVAWASPSLSFCPFSVSSHHSPIPTLENFLHTKLNTILLATLVKHSNESTLFDSGFNSKPPNIKHILL